MNKQYMQPIIKEITLDTKQAILQVCLVGGGYFGWGGTTGKCFKGNEAAACLTAVKGQAYTGSGGDTSGLETDTQPS